MIDWSATAHSLAIVLAVAGGGASVLAYHIRRRELRDGGEPAPRSHITYLASYILMSLSIFCLALSGLL